MKEEKIEAVKAGPEPQTVRDIQVFLGFANFYTRFIQNFSRIAVSLTSMLQTTDNEALSTQAIENEKNQDAPSATSGANGGNVGGNIKNLSTAAKLAKSKKPNFAKANSKTDFLTPGAKEIFIHLRKALPRLRFLGILIQSVIFRLKLMLRDMLLVGS